MAVEFFFMTKSPRKNVPDVVVELGAVCVPNPFEPQRDKTNKMTCASNEDSDQPVKPRSLIRVFAVRTKKVWVNGYPLC